VKAVAAWVPGLGPLESAIMTVIWDADQSLSVRVVRGYLDYLAADAEDPAYTTVMSVMVILWRKGFLDRAKCPGAGTGEPGGTRLASAGKTTSPPSSVKHLPAHPTQRPSCAEPPLKRRDVAPRTRDARTSGLSTPSSPWCGPTGRTSSWAGARMRMRVGEGLRRPSAGWNVSKISTPLRPPPGLLHDFPRCRDGTVLTRIDVAARYLPSPTDPR
jgi:hypothetical protein